MAGHYEEPEMDITPTAFSEKDRKKHMGHRDIVVEGHLW